MTLRFDKKYISLILFIGFSLFLILFIIFPLLEKIKDNSRQLLQGREQKLSFSLEKENLKNSKIIYEKIMPDLGKSENLFFAKETPIELEFIKFLEKTASSSNVSIRISSVDSGNNKNNQLSLLSLNLEASGSFSNFFKFVEKLENSSYLIEITNLNINKAAKNDSTEENVGASLSLTVLKK